MTTLETLALSHLTLWCHDRSALRHGVASRLHRDARQARTIDFERAFTRLDPDERVILLLTHRDGLKAGNLADILGVGESHARHLAQQALSHLATTLDRLDLL